MLPTARAMPPLMFTSVPDRKRKRHYEPSSDSEPDHASEPSPSSRPRKISPRLSVGLGLPADEPLNIDSRTAPAATSRRPRARALECADHSWGCRLCGK